MCQTQVSRVRAVPTVESSYVTQRSLVLLKLKAPRTCQLVGNKPTGSASRLWAMPRVTFSCSHATRHLIDYWLSAHSCVRARHVEVRAAEAARLAQVVIRAFDQQKAWPAEPRHIFARAVLISHESCALAIKASSDLPRVR